MNGWAIAVICIASGRVATGFILDGQNRDGKVSAWKTLGIIGLDIFLLIKAGLFS